MPVCDEKTSKENNDKAAKADIRYNGVRVLVTASENNFIRFSAGCTDGSTREFTAIWGDLQIMWPACPSTLSADATPEDPGPAPRVGTAGELYLSNTFVDLNKILAVTPKWPIDLGDPLPEYKRISLWPKSVVVTVVRVTEAGMFETTVDLLNPRFARPGQVLALGNNPVELQLSDVVFGAIGATFNLPSHTPWAWDELTSAIADIEDGDRRPDKLSAAWTVVDICVTEFKAADAAGRVPPEQKDGLRRVLPQHPALQ